MSKQGKIPINTDIISDFNKRWSCNVYIYSFNTRGHPNVFSNLNTLFP